MKKGERDGGWPRGSDITAPPCMVIVLSELVFRAFFLPNFKDKRVITLFGQRKIHSPF